eukprot:Awhi_evm1s11362
MLSQSKPNAILLLRLITINIQKVNKKTLDCVSWNEQVLISLSPDNYHYGDGKLYAHMSSNGEIFSFEDGGADPMGFYIRPPFGETRSGCLMQDEKFVLAHSNAPARFEISF